MLCPVCRHDNLQGEDNCENCGADLRTADIPEQAVSFHGRLLGEHLDDLGVGTPTIISADAALGAAITRMHEVPTDCLLVTDSDRLVGIFTERDAVLKVAGVKLDAFDVRDFMTRDPVVLRHDDTIAVAINKMAVGGFRHIPIVEDGRPIGVVAARDVFRHILSVLG
ncbi:MAG: CBS domain-containing protein [Chloroflexi bacterium]|nr:MAG: CBS domain-containing protein [Chloroflexota bacterium]